MLDVVAVSDAAMADVLDTEPVSLVVVPVLLYVFEKDDSVPL